MRTVCHLFETLVAPEHLDAAIAETARGKRRRPDVAQALLRRDELIARLSIALSTGDWRPSGFDLLRVQDPKRRLIARAPIEDRVVHAALAMLLEPIFLRSARPESFACRPGFGAHRAVLALQGAMRRHRFVLHLDIRSYFPSVDPDLALELVARRVRDAALLAVLGQVLESGRGLTDDPALRAWARLDPGWPPPGRGLPIGARTSQLLAAVVYLDELDHTLKREWRVPATVRYVDDLFLFGDSRAAVRGWRADVARWLQEERGLRLKHPDAPILSCAGHLDALGVRVRRASREALPRARRRFLARLRAEVLRPKGARRVNFRRCVAASVGVALF